jgi:hypothetical protein
MPKKTESVAERTVLAIFGSALLFAIHQLTVAIVAQHAWVRLSAADWAAWLGAFGTIGALVGAIWIANTQTRIANETDLLRARLYASAMTMRLKQTSIILQIAADNFENYSAMSPDLTIFENCRGQIAGLIASKNFYAVDELIPLAPLPNGVAALLSNSYGLLTAFDHLVDSGINRGRARNLVSRLEFAEELKGHLLQTKQWVQKAQTECESATLALSVVQS